MELKITPKFKSREIIDKVIRAKWYQYQKGAMSIGAKMTVYMQNYINSNRKRRGGTGNLAKSINFYPKRALKTVSWGIGLISELEKYWYVINFGKMFKTGEPFIPYRGKTVLGSFEGGRPDPALAGGVERFNKNDGTGFGMSPKNPVRPINYIQATQMRLNANLRNLLRRLKGKGTASRHGFGLGAGGAK